jgi:hypothetical protein
MASTNIAVQGQVVFKAEDSYHLPDLVYPACSEHITLRLVFFFCRSTISLQNFITGAFGDGRSLESAIGRFLLYIHHSHTSI